MGMGTETTHRRYRGHFLKTLHQGSSANIISTPGVKMPSHAAAAPNTGLRPACFAVTAPVWQAQCGLCSLEGYACSHIIDQHRPLQCPMSCNVLSWQVHSCRLSGILPRIFHYANTWSTRLC